MSADVRPGFSDPVEAAQRHFRALLEAMARPGRIRALSGELPAAPAPMAPAAFALGLTLLDYETPVWLDPALSAGPVAASLRFHCGCPLVEEPPEAAFAFSAEPAKLPPLAAFAPGTPEYPDRSTTLVLQVAGLEEDGVGGVQLTGPGIQAEHRLAAVGLADGFWRQVQANHRRFPQGVDLVLVSGGRIAALPRSTRVEAR
jgi:alpha-D-ribose 1-methylphosphonate 5-triphosphate synthase subunit PhnH